MYDQFWPMPSSMEGILFDNNGFHNMVIQGVVLEPKLDVLSSRGDHNNVEIYYDILWECPIILVFILAVKDFNYCSLSQKKNTFCSSLNSLKLQRMNLCIVLSFKIYPVFLYLFLISSLYYYCFIRFHNFRMNLFAFLSSSDELLF
jgi:hypothetical protein